MRSEATEAISFFPKEVEREERNEESVGEVGIVPPLTDEVKKRGAVKPDRQRGKDGKLPCRHRFENRSGRSRDRRFSLHLWAHQSKRLARGRNLRISEMMRGAQSHFRAMVVDDPDNSSKLIVDKESPRKTSPKSRGLCHEAAGLGEEARAE